MLFLISCSVKIESIEQNFGALGEFDFQHGVLCNESVTYWFMFPIPSPCKLLPTDNILNEKCIHKMVLELIGERSRDPFAFYKGPINNCEDLLAYGSDNGLFAIMQITYLCRLVLGFFFERYTEAAIMAEKFRECQKGVQTLNSILHPYFEGLVSFQLARRSKTRSKWMTLGEAAIETFRSWVTHSSWNFENKLAILEAESYFCRGIYDEAENKYKHAIKYSRMHRFVHEEAIALELYSLFLKACGRVDESNTIFAGAMDCYKKWGAFGLLKKKQFQNK